MENEYRSVIPNGIFTSGKHGQAGKYAGLLFHYDSRLGICIKFRFRAYLRVRVMVTVNCRVSFKVSFRVRVRVNLTLPLTKP